MLHTSYFAFAKPVPPEFLVSVAGAAPDGFLGRQYRALAPKYDWWKKWHDENLGDDWYVEKYNETVLSKLDPAEVLAEIGDDKILLCWEAVGKFCHRHLIADWLRAAGADIRELTIFDRNMFGR